jgi:hypothetical protein
LVISNVPEAATEQSKAAKVPLIVEPVSAPATFVGQADGTLEVSVADT